jgi:hypothetical protein
MSHRIVYEHLAVLFPANTLKAELGHWSLYDDRYLLLELGGDNNCSTFHPETNREVASRDWCVLGLGRHYEVIAAAVKLSASCEGGCMRLSGQRKTLPETYIRRVRNAMANPVPSGELGGLGLSVVADIAQSDERLGAEARENLQRHAHPVEGEGRKLWRMNPLFSAKDAALLMVCGGSLPGPAWNVAAASGPRFPCEGSELFHRLRARKAA